jgi:hypothetical protein
LVKESDFKVCVHLEFQEEEKNLLYSQSIVKFSISLNDLKHAIDFNFQKGFPELTKKQKNKKKQKGFPVSCHVH